MNLGGPQTSSPRQYLLSTLSTLWDPLCPCYLWGPLVLWDRGAPAHTVRQPFLAGGSPCIAFPPVSAPPGEVRTQAVCVLWTWGRGGGAARGHSAQRQLLQRQDEGKTLWETVMCPPPRVRVMTAKGKRKTGSANRTMESQSEVVQEIKSQNRFSPGKKKKEMM